MRGLRGLEVECVGCCSGLEIGANGLSARLPELFNYAQSIVETHWYTTHGYRLVAGDCEASFLRNRKANFLLNCRALGGGAEQLMSIKDGNPKEGSLARGEARRAGG